MYSAWFQLTCESALLKQKSIDEVKAAIAEFWWCKVLNDVANQVCPQSC